MADKIISDFPAVGSINLTDLFEIENTGGNSRKVTAQQIVDLAGGVITAADGANVATSQSTASTTYVDLATAGPAVTLTTGSTVLIWLSSVNVKATGGNSSFIGFAVSGATTIAAADGNAGQTSHAAGLAVSNNRCFTLTGLTPGSNTFTMKYRVDGGAAVSFFNRSIIVQALT